MADEHDDSYAERPSRAVHVRAPVNRASRAAATTTTVEWPSANQQPTPTGFWPSAISLRVTLSMAAMWSGSTAWRRPSTQARKAVPSSIG